MDVRKPFLSQRAARLVLQSSPLQLQYVKLWVTSMLQYRPQTLTECLLWTLSAAAVHFHYHSGPVKRLFLSLGDGEGFTLPRPWLGRTTRPGTTRVGALPKAAAVEMHQDAEHGECGKKCVLRGFEPNTHWTYSLRQQCADKASKFHRW